MKHLLYQPGVFLLFLFLTQISAACLYQFYTVSWNLEAAGSLAVLVSSFVMAVYTFLNLKFTAYET